VQPHPVGRSAAKPERSTSLEPGRRDYGDLVSTLIAPPATARADVVVTLFSGSVADLARRGFSEDRLPIWLNADRTVGRLLVCDPPRSVAGRVLRLVRGGRQPPLAVRPGSGIHAPLRLRRSDPVRPARMVARYEAGMRRAAGRLGMESPAVITAHPLVAGFGSFEWARSVTYYAWDDWTASVPHQRWWPAFDEAHQRLRDTGRRVCAVSDAALRSIAPSGPHAVIPNGIEPSEWSTLQPAPEWFAAKPSPRLLYVGSLEGRIDCEQLRAVAEAFPQGSLTLVGPLLDPVHFETLQGLPNIEVRSAVPRTEVARLMRAADVCLIPHVRNDLTVAMSPLKLYEYLAAGRPVAAVDLPPIRAVGGRVALAPAGGNFVPAVERALAMGPASEAERLAFIDENSWTRRFNALLGLALAD
jgi:teichuronic acid biosynthesis glycosyltransferase TuaH